jgi:MFS family permease
MSARSGLVWAVYLPTALLAFGQGLLLPTLPLYAAEFGISYTAVSLIVSAAAIGTLLTDVPAGALLARLGLRRAMLGGSGLVAVATLALAFDPSLPGAVALRLLAGVGTAVWALSRHAFIAAAIPSTERGRAISVFGGINRIGVLAGPLLGGIIAEWLGFQAVFVASGMMGLAALLLSIRFIKPGTEAPERTTHGTRWRTVGRMLRTNSRDLTAAAVAQTFAQMIRAGRQLIIPLYGQEVLGLDAGQIGLIMSVSSLLDVAMFFPAGILMDRFGRKVAAVPSFAVMAVGVALIPFASDFAGLLFAAAVIGFGNGLGSGTMMTLGADLAPPGATGEFLGLWRLIGDAGASGGPLVVGAMAGAFGLEGSALALSAIGIGAALTLALLVRETRQSPLTAT